MQEALQVNTHFAQRVHRLSIIRILNTETRDNNPRKVPTGQIVLQYSLPCLKENQATRANMTEGSR